jgi:hypothetical protein
VLDLSGSFRTGHPHSLSLVAAVARVVEDRLAAERARRDERLKALYLERIARGVRERTALVTRTGRVLAASPRGWLGSRVRIPMGEGLTLPTGEQLLAEPIRGAADAILLRAGRAARRARPKLALRALGHGRALVELDGQGFELSPRHSEIVALLAAHPQGLSSRELARELYGPGGKRGTVRAEMSRLRAQLGPVLARNPYRLDADVSADPAVADQLVPATPLQPPQRRDILAPRR